LRYSIDAFEEFVDSLGQDLYHVEPLYYHNAILFERYGFNYQQGRKRMEDIDQAFSPTGSVLSLLDNSTPFRRPAFAKSIRGRSWAIHDGILGQPHTQTTMYKLVASARPYQPH
jgi:hypothetical protein